MGDLSAFRDEGCSKDYLEAMWRMLNQDKFHNGTPNDYIVATNDGATIEDMFRYVCSIADLNFEDVYELDERFLRPSDVPYLLGNSSKVRRELQWEPKYTWKSLFRSARF